MSLSACCRLWISLTCVLLFLPACAFACKCAPARPVCEDVRDSSVVFVGTVTDTGPTIEAVLAEFRKKFSQKEIEAIENSDDLSLPAEKALWRRMMPEEARSSLRRVRTMEQLQQLITKYFPILSQWDRPVRFAVDETLIGEPMPVREVWTGQGFGDCGVNFEAGRKYLVYASRDKATGREQTSICSGPHVHDESSADLAYLRAARDGSAKPAIFGIVTSDLDEFRSRSLWSVDDPVQHPVPGIQLRIESGAERLSTQTDASGRFAFRDLRSGRYTVTAATGPEFQVRGLPKTVDLRNAGCSVNVILVGSAADVR